MKRFFLAFAVSALAFSTAFADDEQVGNTVSNRVVMVDENGNINVP